MKVVDFNIKEYDLPLVKPIKINSETIHRRKGVIIFLTDDAGLVGFGETAPLAGVSREHLDEAISQLKSLKPKICGLRIPHTPLDFDGQLNKLFSEDLLPSVRFGIEMAIFNLLRQTDKRRPGSKAAAVCINGLVTAEDNMLGEVKRLVQDGFSTIKIKVGRCSIDEDINMIRMLREVISGRAKLRLDANRAWGLADAKTFCKQISHETIEYIEEPLRDIAHLGDLFKETGIPIALDETIVERRTDAVDLKAIEAFVLKPDLLGGFDEAARLVRFAKENHKKVCLSSTFQTSATLEALATFAVRMNITDTTHGLDTRRWLAEDLFINPLRFSNGAINLSQSPPLPDNLRMDLLKDIDW